MTKVLVLANSVSHRKAGAAHATLDFANALGRRLGGGVSLCAWEYDEGSIDPSVDVIRYRRPAPRRGLWRIRDTTVVSDKRRSLNACDLGRFDVCVAQGTTEALAFRRLHPEVPIVTHTGAILSSREHAEESNGQSFSQRVNGYWKERYERLSYAQPGWEHVVSTPLVGRQREEHFGLPEDFFHVCPYGISEKKFDRSEGYADIRARYDIPATATVIATVCRLVRWKNVDWVIRSLAPLSNANAYLLVVGDGPERSGLAALAQELGVDSRVRFAGHVADPAPFYSAADLFVLPSLIESFGVVYAEAMFFGLPCIGLRNDPPAVLSSAVDVIPEGEAGYCVSTEDELQGRLVQLIDDPQERCRLGENGYRLAKEKYTTDHYVDFFLNLVHERFGIGLGSGENGPARRPASGCVTSST